MSDLAFYKAHDFEPGDKIWWFKSNCMYGCCIPINIELIHDTVKEVKNGVIYCEHSIRYPREVWGKSRREAWKNLKDRIEKGGIVE